MFEFHVCYECTPPHIDNCGTCFGYGLNGKHIVTAHEASMLYLHTFTSTLPDNTIQCPECGSDIRGYIK